MSPGHGRGIADSAALGPPIGIRMCRPPRAWAQAAGNDHTMPKDNRKRTREARAAQAATGGRYTDALTAVTSPAPPRLDRDSIPDPLTASLAFAEIMAVGRRVAVYADSADLGKATQTVRAAITPLWPQTPPEVARDVLVACAELTVTRGYKELAAVMLNPTARTVLELCETPRNGADPRSARDTPEGTARPVRELSGVRPGRRRADPRCGRATDRRRAPALRWRTRR